MERDEIESLLDRYWKAETTVEEEKIIKKYFAQQEGAHAEEQSFFTAVSEYQNLKGENVIIEKKAGWFFNNGSYLMKAASILIIGILCTVSGIKYNQHLEDEKTAAMCRNVEDQLQTVSKVLNAGYADLDQSAQVISNIKKSKN